MSEEEELNAEAGNDDTTQPQTDVNAQTSEPVSPPPQPAPATSTDAQPIRTVPLEVLLRTREESAEKYRKAQAEAAHYRRQAEEYERRQREAAAKRPDMFAEPDAYEAWLDERFGQRLTEATQPLQQTISDLGLRNSELNARINLGPEKFEQLNAWIREQPDDLHAHFMSTQDPYGAAWQEYRRSATFTRLGPKTLDEFLEEQKQAWLAEQAAAATNGQDAQNVQTAANGNGAAQPRGPDGKFASPSASQSAPRRPSAPSLANVEGAPSASGSASSGYDALFRK